MFDIFRGLYPAPHHINFAGRELSVTRVLMDIHWSIIRRGISFRTIFHTKERKLAVVLVWEKWARDCGRWLDGRQADVCTYLLCVWRWWSLLLCAALCWVFADFPLFVQKFVEKLKWILSRKRLKSFTSGVKFAKEHLKFTLAIEKRKQSRMVDNFVDNCWV